MFVGERARHGLETCNLLIDCTPICLKKAKAVLVAAPLTGAAADRLKSRISSS